LAPNRPTWAKRAGEVIGRIRGFINKVPPRHDPLDINQAIFEATTLTRNELMRHRIGMEIRLAQELPVVRGDRVQLQQVLLNLIVNAIESMSAVNEGQRELLISSAINAADSVLVAVRDSGPGLTPEGFDRAFQAFHTTKPDGMGVGLSISRRIVEAHGGRLWATANAPRGATFQFTLPARRESPS
jgi:C4-dicarboxylate-specific signal transduction histidine kinase